MDLWLDNGDILSFVLLLQSIYNGKQSHDPYPCYYRSLLLNWEDVSEEASLPNGVAVRSFSSDIRVLYLQCYLWKMRFPVFWRVTYLECEDQRCERDVKKTSSHVTFNTSLWLRLKTIPAITKQYWHLERRLPAVCRFSGILYDPNVTIRWSSCWACIGVSSENIGEIL